MNRKIAGAAFALAIASTLSLSVPAFAATTPTSSHTAVKITAQSLPNPGIKYANALVDAWGAGNQKEVATLTNPAADKALTAFAKVGGKDWAQSSTRAGGDVQYTTFVDRTRGEALVIGVDNSLAAKWANHSAISARFLAYSESDAAIAYADQLVHAWQGKQVLQMAELATARVDAMLTRDQQYSSGTWVRATSTVRLGETIVTYENAASHKKLVLAVNGKLDLAHAAHAVNWAAISSLSRK